MIVEKENRAREFSAVWQQLNLYGFVWLQDWAMRDGCTGGPTTFFQKAEVTGEQWIGCQGGAAVVHYRVEGGGHTWPGAASHVSSLGATTHTIDATMLIWQFFQMHALPGAGGPSNY